MYWAENDKVKSGLCISKQVQEGQYVIRVDRRMNTLMIDGQTYKTPTIWNAEIPKFQNVFL